jgi:hypothetical protein
MSQSSSQHDGEPVDLGCKNHQTAKVAFDRDRQRHLGKRQACKGCISPVEVREDENTHAEKRYEHEEAGCDVVWGGFHVEL